MFNQYGEQTGVYVFTHGEEICSLNVYRAVRRSHVYERKRSEGEGGGGEGAGEQEQDAREYRCCLDYRRSIE